MKAFFAVIVSVASLDTYNVTVSRIDQDLYRDHRSNSVIETQYCHEYATRVDAIVRWNGAYSSTNALIFDYNQCRVVAIH